MHFTFTFIFIGVSTKKTHLQVVLPLPGLQNLKCLDDLLDTSAKNQFSGFVTSLYILNNGIKKNLLSEKATFPEKEGFYTGEL